MNEPAPLAGRTVGVTADRRGDDQVVMFRRLGAEVVLGPTISTVKLPDPDLLRRRTQEVISSPPDYLIANTGLGIRTWMDAADGWDLGEGLREALRKVRVATRGPKVAGALSSAGVTTWWRSPAEQLGDVVEHLVHEGLAGRAVALQLHGDDGPEIVARLEAAGARVTTLPVYLWQPPEDPGPALGLIERACAGGLDAVTFTAGRQVSSLLSLADTVGRRRELLAALNHPERVVGCIGPVCAAAARREGISDVVVPTNWRLGSLVKAVAEAVAASG